MKKILSSVLMFAMAVPLSLVPVSTNAAGVYLIGGGYSLSGTVLTVSGTATSTNMTGSSGNQHMAIDWDTDQDHNPETGTSQWQVANVSGFSWSPAFSGGGFTATWNGSRNYTPGNYTVRVMVYHGSVSGNDGSAALNTLVFSIVIPPNGAPIAFSNATSTPEDTAKSVTLVATDTNPLTYSIVTSPTNGSLGVVSGNQVIYTPNLNYTGSDMFTFRAFDGTSFSNIATTTITVTPVNDAPTSAPSTVTIAEDTSLVASLSADDIDGNSLVYSTTTNPTNGVLTLDSANGQYTYTPNSNFNGSDSFMFKVNDGTTNSNVSTVSITVTPANDAPVLTLGTTTAVTIDELTNFSFTSSATDADGNTLTYSLSGATTTGASINSSTGVFSWTPTEAQGPGVYTFNVVVSDGQSGSDTESITITVNEVNVAPVAQPLTISTHQNTNASGSVIANDSDLPANTLTFSILTQPGVVGASVVMNPNGSFTYTPATDYTGGDSFTYQVSDGTLTSSATVTVNVNNNAVVLNIIANYVTNELVNFQFTMVGTDPDSDPLTYSLVGTVPFGVTLHSTTGLFNWTPGEDQDGFYNFTASVTDGGSTDSKTFSITVNEVNIAPVAANNSYTTGEDTPIFGTLVATDSDLPANTLTYSVVANPANGSITAFATSTGTFTYTPNSNYNGVDSFTFTANDGTTNGNTATVSITVNPMNDAPIVTLIGSSTINMVATTTPFVDPGATGNDTEDGPLTPVVTGTINTNTPGTYTFTYTVTDSDNASASTTRTVIVTLLPVENTQSLCTDGIDNDNDGLIDLADPDCAPFIPLTVDVCSNLGGVQSTVPSDHTELGGVCTPKSSGGGGGGNGPVNFGVVNSNGGGGSVLGASTPAVGQVLGVSCGLYMDKHIRLGSRKNNAEQVRKLQAFLNSNMGSKLPITGFYGPLTFGVVKNFQVKYRADILSPWGLNAPTGLVYLATLRQINNLECPELMLTLPPLIPWSANPNAQ